MAQRAAAEEKRSIMPLTFFGTNSVMKFPAPTGLAMTRPRDAAELFPKIVWGQNWTGIHRLAVKRPAKDAQPVA